MVKYTTEEYVGRQCLCANNDFHEEGQCQNVATIIGTLSAYPWVIVYVCDEECMGEHVELDDYEEVTSATGVDKEDEKCPAGDDDAHSYICKGCGDEL